MEPLPDINTAEVEKVKVSDFVGKKYAKCF